MEPIQHGLYMGLHWTWWLVWAFIGLGLVWALARTLGAPRGERPGARRHDREPHPDTHEDQTTKEITR